jgi:hypothetical protein
MGRERDVSSQEVVTTSAVLIELVVTLVALRLQLRFQLRGERERRRYLIIAAKAPPAGSRVQERRSDGTRLALVAGATEQVAGATEQVAGATEQNEQRQ